jgi:hypothetical protein
LPIILPIFLAKQSLELQVLHAALALGPMAQVADRIADRFVSMPATG